jgi:hypothetical protein
VSVIAAFPKRPLQLSRAAESVLWTGMAIGLVPAFWLAWLFVYEMRPLWDEYRLRDAGAVARASDVSHVRIYNSRYNHNIDFDLRYVIADGTSHTTHVEFDSSWVLDDMLLPLEVRYDPASPQHTSTSYGADYLPSRTLHVLFWSAIPAVWLCFFASGLVSKARDGSRWRLKLAAIAAGPTAVQASLTRLKGNKSSVEIVYSWRDSTGRTLNDTASFERHQGPFWLDTARTRMLALAGPKGESVLPDAGLTTIDLTDHERTRLFVARIEALNLSAAAAAELMNTPIGSIAADAPAPTPAPTAAQAAAAAATEAAKKDIKSGYFYSSTGSILANAAAASASGNRGIATFLRFFLISGVAAAAVAVVAGTMHDRLNKTLAQEVVRYEPFNLADGTAPRSSYVELTGLVDPTLAISALGSESTFSYAYIPLLPLHWHHGDPVVYVLYTESDYYLKHGQPFMIRKTGVLTRGDLPSEIAAALVKRGIKLGTPPIVLKSLKHYRDDHLDIYLTVVLCCGIYGLTALIVVAKVRFSARSMPNDRGRLS